MGARISNAGGGLTLLASIPHNTAFTGTETWYQNLEKYDLILLNCNVHNTVYGGLSGCFIPSMLKDVLNHSGVNRVLMNNKYNNYELACLINQQDKFQTLNETLYIYGIKLG